MKRQPHRGQVLLITVLVLSMAITIALSLIGRSVTDVGMSRNIEESARAFSAAEAGIEEALRLGTVLSPSGPTPYGDGLTYEVTSNIIGGAIGSYTLPMTQQGQTASVWLVEHTDDNLINEGAPYSGRLTIKWKAASDAQIPALEIALYYKNASGVYTVQRGAYDPVSARRSINKFSSVVPVEPGGLVYSQPIVLPVGTPLFIRIRPYYFGTAITVDAGGVLPKQGFEIVSTGQTAGGVTRKIVVRRQYPLPSTIFDYAVYSQNTFIH